MKFIIHYETGPTFADCTSKEIEADDEDHAKVKFETWMQKAHPYLYPMVTRIEKK